MIKKYERIEKVSSLGVDREVRRALKTYCDERGLKIVYVASRAIREYLEKARKEEEERNWVR